jgi:hypothetical protein
LSNWKISTSYWPSSWPRKYMTFAPSWTQAMMVWLSHSPTCSTYFVLQKKIGIATITKKNAWSPLPPFL